MNTDVSPYSLFWLRCLAWCNYFFIIFQNLLTFKVLLELSKHLLIELLLTTLHTSCLITETLSRLWLSFQGTSAGVHKISFILIPKEVSGHEHVPGVFDTFLHASLKMIQWCLTYRDSDSMTPYKATFQLIAFFTYTLEKNISKRKQDRFCSQCFSILCIHFPKFWNFTRTVILPS